MREIARDVIGGLGAQPVLLLIVVLNTAMIFTAGYFLMQQETMRAETVRELIGVVQVCVAR